MKDLVKILFAVIAIVMVGRLGYITYKHFNVDEVVEAGVGVQIAKGKGLFEANCVICHGVGGVGLGEGGAEKDVNGDFFAPSLDGSMHTWHHSPKSLMGTIDNGGARLGGRMPGFKGVLDDAEKRAILDYLYDLWPVEVQKKYDTMFPKGK